MITFWRGIWLRGSISGNIVGIFLNSWPRVPIIWLSVLLGETAPVIRLEETGSLAGLLLELQWALWRLTAGHRQSGWLGLARRWNFSTNCRTNRTNGRTDRTNGRTNKTNGRSDSTNGRVTGPTRQTARLTGPMARLNGPTAGLTGPTAGLTEPTAGLSGPTARPGEATRFKQKEFKSFVDCTCTFMHSYLLALTCESYRRWPRSLHLYSGDVYQPLTPLFVDYTSFCLSIWWQPSFDPPPPHPPRVCVCVCVC